MARPPRRHATCSEPRRPAMCFPVALSPITSAWPFPGGKHRATHLPVAVPVYDDAVLAELLLDQDDLLRALRRGGLQR